MLSSFNLVRARLNGSSVNASSFPTCKLHYLFFCCFFSPPSSMQRKKNPSSLTSLRSRTHAFAPCVFIMVKAYRHKICCNCSGGKKWHCNYTGSLVAGRLKVICCKKKKKKKTCLSHRVLIRRSIRCARSVMFSILFTAILSQKLAEHFLFLPSAVFRTWLHEN